MANCILSFANLRTSMFAAAIIIVAPLFADEQPWDSEPFSGSVNRVLEEMQKRPVPVDSEVEMFLDETIIRFDAEGRRSIQSHLVYRIVTEAGINSYGSVSAAWSPWNEKRPTLSARVINADGSERRLIEREIVEVPAEQSGNIYSDERQLQAPLPGVQIGSFIETLTQVEESEPLFKGGRSEFLMFNRLVDTHKVVWKVVLPEQHPIKFQQFGPGLALSDEIIEGQRHLEWATTERLNLDGFEVHVPSDLVLGTQVVYATGSSWKDVVECYSAMVEEKLQDQNLEEQVKLILAGETDREKKIEKLVSFVQMQIRYTGLMFGNGTIVPTEPNETLRRRYGDCKDQATLLTGLLRTAGIDAHPVLIRSSFGRDARPDMPGLGQFNHMIVHVPGDNEQWIDPTASLVPLRQLPLEDQGRFCLVVKPGETELRRTPKSVAEDNGFRRVREIVINEINGTTMHEVTTYRGANSSELRQMGVSIGDREFRNSLRTSAEERFLTKEVGDIHWSPLRDLTKPVEISCEVKNSGLIECNVREARVVIFPAVIFSGLCEDLLDCRPYITDAEAAAIRENPEHEFSRITLEDKQSRRKNVLVIHQPQVIEFACRIHWPEGFKSQHVPEEATIRIRDGFVESRYESQPDGVLLATFRCSTGEKPLKPGDIERWQKELRKLAATDTPLEWTVELTAEVSSNQHFAKGDPGKGLRAQRAEVARQPTNLAARIRLAESYASQGFVEAGRALSLETLTLAPDSSEAYQSAGKLYSVPSLNNEISFEDFKTAIGYFRKSVELDPADENAKSSLALSLQLHHRCGSCSRESLLEVATSLRSSEVDLNENGHRIVVESLFLAGEYEDTLEYLNQISPITVTPGMKIATASILEGPAKGLDILRSLPKDDREMSLLQAQDFLNGSRHYDVAADLLEAASTELDIDRNPFGQILTTTRTIQKYEKVLLNKTSVHGIIQRVYINAFTKPDFCGETKDLIATDDECRQRVLASFRDRLAGTDIPQMELIRTYERRADSVSLLKYAIEGDEKTGFRVGVVGQRRLNVYLALCGGSLKIVATERNPTDLAEAALAQLDSGNPECARQFVQWAFEDQAVYGDLPQAKPSAAREPFSEAPVLTLWPASSTMSANASKIRLAAIAMADPQRIPNALPFLTSARKTASPAEQLQIDRVMLAWLRSHKRWQEGLAVVDRLMRHPQGRENLWDVKTKILIGLKQYENAKSWSMAAENPESPKVDPLALVGHTAMVQGDWNESLRIFRLLADRDRWESIYFNRAAWAGLYVEKLDERVVVDAEHAAHLDPGAAVLHTLATVYAELGRTEEAMHVIRRSAEQHLDGTEHPEDFYVLGRVAEHMGMADVAALYYKLVIDGNKDERAESTVHLARRRLQMIPPSSRLTDGDSKPPVREVSNSGSTREVR